MKISWIIPSFNSGEFLMEAVESIFTSLPESATAEIIVVDDCSTDKKTISLLATLATDARITVIFQPENGGPAKARNAGIRNATGDWIAFLDSDDMIVPNSLKERVELLNRYPDIRWIAGDMLELREPKKPIHFNSYSKASIEGTLISDGLYKISNSLNRLALWGMLPYLGSMLIRRDLMKEAGLIDETLTYGEDVHFCLVLAHYADLYWTNKPCLLLRRHHESLTKDLVRAAKESPRALKVCLNDPRLKSVSKEIRWRYAADLRQSSKVFLRHEMQLLAIKFAFRAFLRSPNDMRSISALYKSMLPQKF